MTKTLTLKLHEISNSDCSYNRDFHRVFEFGGMPQPRKAVVPERKVSITTRGEEFDADDLRNALKIVGINCNDLSTAVSMVVSVDSEDLQRMVDEALEETKKPYYNQDELDRAMAQARVGGYTDGFNHAQAGLPPLPGMYDNKRNTDAVYEPGKADARPQPELQGIDMAAGNDVTSVVEAARIARDDIANAFGVPASLLGGSDTMYTQAELDAAVAAAVAATRSNIGVDERNVLYVRGASQEKQIGDIAEKEPKYGDFISVHGFPPCSVPVANPEFGYTQHALYAKKVGLEELSDRTGLVVWQREQLQDQLGDEFEAKIAEEFVPVIVTVLR